MKKQLPLIIVVSAILIAVIGYLIVVRNRDSCDTIFTQVSPSVGLKLETIKTKGEILARPEIQQLDADAQKIGVYLKACCVAQKTGNLGAADFQNCVKGAKDFEAHVDVVTKTIEEVEAARAQGNSALATTKTEQARLAASAAADTAKRLERMPAPSPGKEKHRTGGTVVTGNLECRVVSATREDDRVRVEAYVINKGDDSIVLDDSYFRLLIDDVPLAPTNAVSDLLQGHGAKSVTIRFALATRSEAGSASFQVGKAGSDETARIPIELTKK